MIEGELAAEASVRGKALTVQTSVHNASSRLCFGQRKSSPILSSLVLVASHISRSSILAMTSRDTPLTPRRRATRSQPFVGFPTASTSNAQITPSSPIYTRPSIVEDLLEAETELVDAGDVQIGDLETRFHSSFTVRQAGKSTPKKSRNKAVTRTYGRSPRKSLSYVQVDEDEEEEVDDVTHKGQQPYRRDVYKVGDTICVDDRLVEPSVAVIIAIWTVLGDDITPVVHLKVHWFVRPSQLPGIRAKRAYYKVRCLSGTHLSNT